MNTNQYTQKTLEALQAAQQLAVEYQHKALEPEHLLHALATQEQGLIPQLLQKLNVDAGSFSAAVAEKLSAMPRVSGSGRDPDKVYISQATDKVLSAAAREAKAMKDDYVSVEHVFLALLDEQTQNTSELFRRFFRGFRLFLLLFSGEQGQPDGAYHDAQQRSLPAVPGADAQGQDSQKEYHAQRNPPAHYASSPVGGCSGSSTGSPKVIFSMGGSSSRELRPKVRKKSDVVLY